MVESDALGRESSWPGPFFLLPHSRLRRGFLLGELGSTGKGIDGVIYYAYPSFVLTIPGCLASAGRANVQAQPHPWPN